MKINIVIYMFDLEWKLELHLGKISKYSLFVLVVEFSENLTFGNMGWPEKVIFFFFSEYVQIIGIEIISTLTTNHPKYFYKSSHVYEC